MRELQNSLSLEKEMEKVPHIPRLTVREIAEGKAMDNLMKSCVVRENWADSYCAKL